MRGRRRAVAAETCDVTAAPPRRLADARRRARRRSSSAPGAARRLRRRRAALARPSPPIPRGRLRLVRRRGQLPDPRGATGWWPAGCGAVIGLPTRSRCSITARDASRQTSVHNPGSEPFHPPPCSASSAPPARLRKVAPLKICDEETVTRACGRHPSASSPAREPDLFPELPPRDAHQGIAPSASSTPFVLFLENGGVERRQRLLGNHAASARSALLADPRDQRERRRASSQMHRDYYEIGGRAAGTTR